MYKKKLTGEELILAVEELKEFSKTEVIFQCGYYELDDFGSETVDIESFDYALKEAYADRIINPKKRKIPAPYRYQKKDLTNSREINNEETIRNYSEKYNSDSINEKKANNQNKKEYVDKSVKSTIERDRLIAIFFIGAFLVIGSIVSSPYAVIAAIGGPLLAFFVLWVLMNLYSR